MINEYYGAPSTPTSDYLAHYGIKGMKWGVRKAIQTGGERGARRLSKQFAKAQKKLAKLEKRASKTDVYARRAKRMAAGAAVAGGLAAAGTSGVSRGMKLIGKAMNGQRVSREIANAGAALIDVSHPVKNWGNSSSIGKIVKANESPLHKKVRTTSNNTYARIGAGLIGASLAAGAAKNVYRAKTAQKKAAQFRTEMNKAFAGTKYANGGNAQTTVSRKKKKRRG